VSRNAGIVCTIVFLFAPHHSSSGCCESHTPSSSHASSSSHTSSSTSHATTTHAASSHESGVAVGKLAAEVVVNGIAALADADDARRRACLARCVAPSSCDGKRNLCVFLPPGATQPVYYDPLVDPESDAGAAPTCGGLCLTGEVCVIRGGAQDCVPQESTHP
jgi:hypothetical protein